jgi:hypothetical protein
MCPEVFGASIKNLLNIIIALYLKHRLLFIICLANEKNDRQRQ